MGREEASWASPLRRLIASGSLLGRGEKGKGNEKERRGVTWRGFS